MQDTYIIEELSIDVFKNLQKCKSLLTLAKGTGIFVNGLIVDMQSINLICTIYDNLSPINQEKFNDVLHDKYKIANFFDKMWSLVK